MPENLPLSNIKFHYIKSNFFRVIHVDGAIGGITPARQIFVSLFSERAALPKMIEQTIKLDGTLGEEVAREGKEGIVREVEVGIELSLNAAQGLADWLYNQVRVLQESNRETAPNENTAPIKTQ